MTNYAIYLFGFLSGVSVVYISTKLLYLDTRRKRRGIEQLVFDTRIIEIPSLSRLTNCEILGKAEFLNVTGSSKGRLALALVEKAEKEGLISPNTGCTLFEGTVGSTGIALAIVARAKGYKCHIVMPDDQAKEKYAILEALGATVEQVRPSSIIDENHFVNVARRRATEMNEAGTLARGYFCDQFENDANIKIHYETTGPEILSQTQGRLDYFVMGAGTGGTLAGVSLFLKKHIKNLQVILADPQGSGLFNKVKHNTLYSSTEAEGSRKRHQVDTVVEGIGLNRITRNFQIVYNEGGINDAIRVTDQEAVDMSRFVMMNDGLFIGSSTAVNLVACVKLARQVGQGKRILTILCDSGNRHLTKFWNDEYLQSLDIRPNPDSILRL